MFWHDAVVLECQANGNQGVNHEVSVPEALISTIRQRHKFCVKATEHNLSGKTRSLTVTKILSLDTPPATEALAGNHIAATSEETFQTGNDVWEASKSHVDSAEGNKRTWDSGEVEKLNAQSVGIRASVCLLRASKVDCSQSICFSV